MIEKYVVRESGGAVLGLRFVHCQERIEIGGNAKLSAEMHSYLNDFFADSDNDGDIALHWRWSGKNKIRMETFCKVKTFCKGIQQMQAQGIRIKKVKALGRIMR